MNQNKVYLLLISVLLVGSLLVATGYYYSSRKNNLNSLTNNKGVDSYKTADNVVNTDPAYDSMKALFSEGKRDEAAQVLQDASIKYATGSPERNVIDLDYAILLSISDNPIRGTKLLKQIVLQPNKYFDLTRALAVEALARQYFTFHDINLRAETFSGEPFAQLLVKNNGKYDGVYQSLLEYGMSLHPTPISAVRIAEAKALQLDSVSMSSSTKSLLKNEVDDYIIKAEQQKKNVENLASYKAYTAEYYSILARVYLYLIASGYPDYKQQAEEAYKNAIVLSDGSLQVFVLFGYGSYLGYVTPKDTAKIEDVANRLVSHPAYDRVIFDKFVKNALSLNKNDQGYRWIVVFSKSSPTFDNYVKSIK